MKRIKVLHVIGGGEFGGAEQHLLTLINYLDKNEFEVDVACLFAEPLADKVRKSGFKCHVFSMKNKFDFSPITTMANLIVTEKYDIVHTHGVRANLIGRLAAKKAGHSRIITTVHSVLSLDYKRQLDKLVNSISEKLTHQLTHKFITVCRMLEGQLIADGINTDKIITIHNGIELKNYSSETDGSYVRREFNIPDQGKLISVVARLHPVKGHKYLLQAFAEIVKNKPNVYLLLAGSGPCREELEQLTNELGLSQNVIFAGFRKDIPEIISTSDFIVLPSLSEGLSLTVVEAMAMKKTVVATRVGGTPEIITHGHDGILVPPADPEALRDALNQLIDDEKLLSEIGRIAHLTVEKGFTANLMASKTAAVYKELLRDVKV